MPIASFEPGIGATGESDLGSTSNTNWLVEPQISYRSIIGKGQVSVLVGATEQQTKTNGLHVAGTGYTSDDLLNTLTAAPTLNVNQNSIEYRYNAIFARITYNWEDKYLLNISARRDGSSRFGPGNQFGNFGAIGAAWIFTEEQWFKDHPSFLSFGKIRGSYGTTGSDGVGDYQYLTQYSPNGALPYGGISPLRPIVEANPNFHWQVNKKLEGALNLGFFKDWVELQLVYYRERIGDQLVGYPLPALTGFTTVTANSPALVQNSGMEYTASSKIIETSRFSWSMNFDLAMNNNKLVSYPNFSQSPYVGQLIVGQPLNLVYLLHYIGVDPLTGNPIFEDKNHDGRITENYPTHNNDDMYALNLNPKFFGGFGMNFRYGSFDLSMFFNFKKQLGVNSLSGTNFAGVVATNQPVDLLNRWQQPGDVAKYGKFTSLGGGNYFTGGSDAVYTDASYIKLSNLSLSYNFPASLLRKLGVNRLSLFAHANNLLTLTKYQGADPEAQNFGGIPTTRTVVCGLSLNL